MIISHRHKFIFIKTSKTAGTSIEIALSQFCGDDDVITPISRHDEITRRDLGYAGPQNYLAPRSDYRLLDVARRVLRGKRKPRYYNHMAARDVKPLVGDGIWSSYFKFCFERNPFDRVISLYYWRNKAEPRPSLSAFLESGAPLLLQRRGFDLYTIDGRIVMDRVCMFENMDEELERLRVQLGLTEPLRLPRAKSSSRKDMRNFRELLNEHEMDTVRALFSRELALFDYES
jgi:hypothetical protein